MSNVSRHARAKTVSVHLGREGAELILRVEDDGQGFEPKARACGLGLQGITERLERFQGHLEIDSSPGAGTRLIVRIPLKAATPPPIPETMSSIATTAQAFSPTAVLGLLLAFTPGIMPATFFSTEAETRLSSWLFPSLALLAIINYLWSSRRKRSAKSPPPNSPMISLRTSLLFATAYCWAPHFWWAYARTNLLISIPLLALSISAGFLASLALWRFSSRKSINLHAFGSSTAIFWFAWVLLSSTGPALTYSWGFWSLSFLSGYLAIAIYLAGIILIWHEQRAARRVSL